MKMEKKKCELFQQAAQRTLARNKNNKTSEINRQIFFFARVKGGRTLWSIEVGVSFLHALFIKGI